MTRQSDFELFSNEVVLAGDEQSLRFRQLTSRSRVFDIYLPDSICGLRATDRFIDRLGMFSEGATLYQGVKGDWYNVSEAVRVLRMSITTIRADGEVLGQVEDVRAAVRKIVSEYMRDLIENHHHTEAAIFFNDWAAALGNL
jgi:hypothetical protein